MSKGTFVSKPIEKYVRDRLPVFDTMLSNLCKSFNNATDLIVQCIKKAYFTCAIFHLSIKNLEAHLKHHLDRFIKKYNNGFNVSDNSINALLNNDKTFPSYISNRARTICYNALVRLFWLTDFISDKKNEETVRKIEELIMSEGADQIISNDVMLSKSYNGFLTNLNITRTILFTKQMFILMLNLIDNKITNQYKIEEKFVIKYADFRENLRFYFANCGNKIEQKSNVIRIGKAIFFARGQNFSLHQTLSEMGRYEEIIDSFTKDYLKAQNIKVESKSTEKTLNNNDSSPTIQIKAVEKPLSHSESIIEQARDGINSQSEILYKLTENFIFQQQICLRRLSIMLWGKWDFPLCSGKYSQDMVLSI